MYDTTSSQVLNASAPGSGIAQLEVNEEGGLHI